MGGVLLCFWHSIYCLNSFDKMSFVSHDPVESPELEYIGVGIYLGSGSLQRHGTISRWDLSSIF